MGDCIMAFWGAPLPDENHKQNATAALVEMRVALEELNERLREEGLDTINTGAESTQDSVSSETLVAVIVLITLFLATASILLLD